METLELAKKIATEILAKEVTYSVEKVVQKIQEKNEAIPFGVAQRAAIEILENAVSSS